MLKDRKVFRSRMTAYMCIDTRLPDSQGSARANRIVYRHLNSMCGLCARYGYPDTSADTGDGEDYTSGSDEDELDAAPVPKRQGH